MEFSTGLLRSKAEDDASITRPRSLASTHPSADRRNGPGPTAPFIEDVVALPEGLDLFLVRHGLPVHDRITACCYGNSLKSTPVLIDMLPDRRLTVICSRPSPLQHSQEQLKAESLTLELDNGTGSPPIKPRTYGAFEPVRWDDALVYAVQSTDEDVILYVKNDLESKRATQYTNLENFRCQFGRAAETPVTAGASQVFRCETPPRLDHPAARVKVQLVYDGKAIPSIAYYEQPSRTLSSNAGGGLPNQKQQEEEKKEMKNNNMKKKKHLVCSCTMIWNVAKFLKEWVIFNADLGVEKFFLYDNNSEDDITGMVSELAQFNVTRRSWPWVKTQEAGFSHCAVEAQRECTWILFTDVDEYLFPKRWLELAHPEGPRSVLDRSPLAALIEDTVTGVALPAVRKTKSPKASGPPRDVGQISFPCRNFGPSGLMEHPADGVTQGYICRQEKDVRQKSMVYYSAMKSTLQNVIHHFDLEPDYRTVQFDIRKAVVNHYKFQAWSEFSTKFTKRASTYVIDWKERKNLKSNDRPEGMGPDATKPPDWETRYCEKNDTALRDYARRRFGVPGEGGDSVLKMAWEL